MIALYTLFEAFFIVLGFWLVAKYLWMVIYQLKYGENYGERYIKGQISKEEKEDLRKSWRVKIK